MPIGRGPRRPRSAAPALPAAASPSGHGRPSTTARGRVGEAVAVAALERAGYRIVERNYRCRLGELDVVARDGETLVFVEVRSRAAGDRGTALETVNAAKQRQVARVAEHYLVSRRPTFSTCRFDVIGITGDQVVLIKDAFRLG